MKTLSALLFFLVSLVAQAKPFKLTLSYPESVVKADGDRTKILKSDVYLQVRKTGEQVTGDGTIPVYEIVSPEPGSPERKLLDSFFEMNDPVRPHRKDKFSMVMSMLWQNCNAESSEVNLDLNFGANRALSSLEQRKNAGEPIDDPGLISYALNGCHAKLNGCQKAHDAFKSNTTSDEEKSELWSNLMKATDSNLIANCCLIKRMNFVSEEGRWKVSTRGMIDIAAFYQKLEKCDNGLWSINGSLKRSFEKTPNEVPEKHTAQK